MIRFIVMSVAVFLLFACVKQQTPSAYPAVRSAPVLPRYYPRYDPEADNPPYYPGRNVAPRRAPADYYRRAYPYYDPEADNPPYFPQQRDPRAPRDGFARPLFD